MGRWRRFGRFVGGIVVMAGVVGCRGPYTRNVALMSKAEAGEDLDVLVADMKAIHPALYHRTPEKEFEREVAEARGALHEGMEPRELEWVAMRLAGSVGDAHTESVDSYWPYWSAGGVGFPLGVEANGAGGLTVCRVPAKEGTTPGVKTGMRLLEVDGEPVTEMMRRYRGYVSLDDDRGKDGRVADRFGSMLWHEKGERKWFWVRVADAEGHHEQVTRVEAVTRAEMDGMRAAKAKAEAEGKGDRGKRERYPYRFYEGGRVCVIETRQFDYTLMAEWATRVDRMFGEMKEKGTKLLVLDMRWNNGGDSQLPELLVRRAATRPVVTLSKEWRYSWAYRHGRMVKGLYDRGVPSWLWLDYLLQMEWFAPMKIDRSQLVDGEWFRWGHGRVDPIDTGWKGEFAVLVNRYTWSAAVDAAALVKDNHVGVAVGEETGGHASAYTEVGYALLPNSGIEVSVASAHVERPGGFDDGRGVLPDVEADPNLPVEKLIEKIEEYLKGRGRTGWR